MIENIQYVNENGFNLFPIGSNVFFKRENVEAIVTAHGWSVNNTGRRIGIKVKGKLGSSLLYNREVMPCELEILN